MEATVEIKEDGTKMIFCGFWGYYQTEDIDILCWVEKSGTKEIRHAFYGGNHLDNLYAVLKKREELKAVK